MKSMRTPLLLLGALLVLGGLAYWDDWKTQKEETEKKAGNKLFAFDDKTATAIDFFHKGEGEGADVALRLEKKGEEWLITQPIEAKASQDEVVNLLKNVHEYQYERVAAESKDRWKDFGLEHPQARISVHTPDGEHTLLLGIKAPVGYSMYAASGKGDTAYIGSQYIDLATNKKLFDFRDKTLVAIKTDDLAKLVFTKGEESPIVMAREGDKWSMTAPQSFAVDPDEVTAFLNSINAERVETFFDQPSEALQKAFTGKSKEAKTLARLAWETKDGTKRELTFVQKGAELFASEAPQRLIVRVAEGMSKKLGKTANDFRFRKVFAFDPLKAKSVTIDGITYEKQADKWTRKGQGESADHVGSLLSDLSQAKTDRFEDLAGKFAQNLGTPKHSLTLTLDDPNLSTVEISLWADKSTDGKFFLKHTGGNYLYRVDARAIQHISSESSAQAPALDDAHDNHDHG